MAMASRSCASSGQDLGSRATLVAQPKVGAIPAARAMPEPATNIPIKVRAIGRMTQSLAGLP